MRKITKAEKEKTVRNILQMLNGLRQYDATEILYELRKQIDNSLWIIVPEDEQLKADLRHRPPRGDYETSEVR